MPVTVSVPIQFTLAVSVARQRQPHQSETMFPLANKLLISTVKNLDS
jgi:hypothetical protein